MSTIPLPVCKYEASQQTKYRLHFLFETFKTSSPSKKVNEISFQDFVDKFSEKRDSISLLVVGGGKRVMVMSFGHRLMKRRLGGIGPDFCC